MIRSTGKRCKSGSDNLPFYHLCPDSHRVQTVKKYIYLALVVLSFYSANTFANGGMFPTQGEAHAVCQSDAAAMEAWANANVPSWHFGCVVQNATSYRCKGTSGTTQDCTSAVGVTVPYYQWSGTCPTTESNFSTGNPPPTTACFNYCQYSLNGSTGVSVCTSSSCLMHMIGTGLPCDGTEGATPGGNDADDCTVENGVITCDCTANPDASFCPGGPNNDPNDCFIDPVSGNVACYTPDDPNHPPPPPPDDPNLPPNNPDPDDTPDQPDTPTPPPPTPTPGGDPVPDGDTTVSDSKDDSDNANGIISAVNQVTAAVNNATAEIDSSGNQITAAVDTARKQITDANDNNAKSTKAALEAQTTKLIAQSNYNRTQDFIKDQDNTKKITDGLKKACNPLSDASCAAIGSASAVGNCAAPPPCTSPDPVACAQLLQSYEIMCAIMEGDEPVPNTNTASTSTSCETPPVCTSDDPVDCLAANQIWQSNCSALDRGAELAPWEPGGDVDYDRDLADEATAIDASGGTDQSGFATGSCPADIPIATKWTSFNLDTSYICTYADIIRVFVIMITLMWSGTYIVRSF